MNDIPISKDTIKTLKEVAGVTSTGSASIREIAQLINVIESKTGVKFIRMEMGAPGLPSPQAGIEAEIAALRKGLSAVYPDIRGVSSLKSEASRFIKLFLDVDIKYRRMHPHRGINDGINGLFSCRKQE